MRWLSEIAGGRKKETEIWLRERGTVWKILFGLWLLRSMLQESKSLRHILSAKSKTLLKLLKNRLLIEGKLVIIIKSIIEESHGEKSPRSFSTVHWNQARINWTKYSIPGNTIITINHADPYSLRKRNSLLHWNPLQFWSSILPSFLQFPFPPLVQRSFHFLPFLPPQVFALLKRITSSLSIVPARDSINGQLLLLPLPKDAK